MVTYIPTKTVAKLIRAELAAHFLGVKFSVRCGTGTGSAWIRVSYDDGPTYDQVAEVARAFEGQTFNGMNDSYDDNGTVLIARENGELPEESRYLCDGVNVARTFTEAAHIEAQRIIRTNSNVRHLVICDDAGTLVQGNLVGPDDEVAIIGGRVQRAPWMNADQAVQLALNERDLTPSRTH